MTAPLRSVAPAPADEVASGYFDVLVTSINIMQDCITRNAWQASHPMRWSRGCAISTRWSSTAPRRRSLKAAPASSRHCRRCSVIGTTTASGRDCLAGNRSEVVDMRRNQSFILEIETTNEWLSRWPWGIAGQFEIRREFLNPEHGIQSGCRRTLVGHSRSRSVFYGELCRGREVYWAIGRSWGQWKNGRRPGGRIMRRGSAAIGSVQNLSHFQSVACCG